MTHKYEEMTLAQRIDTIKEIIEIESGKTVNDFLADREAKRQKAADEAAKK